jgi:serine/threonine protein kinase
MSKLMSSLPFGTLLDGLYKIVQVISAAKRDSTSGALDIQEAGETESLVKPQKLPDRASGSLQTARRRLISETETVTTLSDREDIPYMLACFDKYQAYQGRELMEGTPLSAELIPGKPWTEERVVHLLRKVLRILELAHRQGAVHGHLKPDKIIRRTCDGSLVVIDFASVGTVTLESGESFDCATDILGAPTPTTAANQPVAGWQGPGADISALSLIGMQALTGLSADQLTAELEKNSWEQLVPVSASARLVAILNNMVHHSDKNSSQSATEVLQALEELAGTEESTFLQVSAGQPAASQETHESGSPEVKPQGSPKLESTELQFLPSLSSSAETPNTDEAPPALPETARPTGSRSLSRFVAPIGIAIGMAANAAAVAFAMYNLLLAPPLDPGKDTFVRASEQYQAGNFQQAVALAKSVPTYSSVYYDAGNALKLWQQDWQKAGQQVKLVEKAFKESRWLDVFKEAERVPKISDWQKKIEPFIRKAAPKTKGEVQKLLKQASDGAARGDFSLALTFIQDIPKGVPDYPKVEAKIAEYTEKRHVKMEAKAEQLFQTASKRAAAQDFAGAIRLIKKIPQGTSAYEKGQAQLVNFTHKRRVNADKLLQQAYSQANAGNFAAALRLLQQIPEGTTAYITAKTKRVEYTTKLRNQIKIKSAAPVVISTGDWDFDPRQQSQLTAAIPAQDLFSSSGGVSAVSQNTRTVSSGPSLTQADPVEEFKEEFKILPVILMV